MPTSLQKKNEDLYAWNSTELRWLSMYSELRTSVKFSKISIISKFLELLQF